MNRTKLRKEGEKWVHDKIISEEQLDEILASYVKKDQSYILVLFAVLLMSIGIFIFVFSDWAQVPQLSRIIVMIVSMLTLYLFGHYFFTRHTNSNEESKHTKIDNDKRSRIYGISFIVLGYIFFGASLLLLINMYNVTLLSIWPFIIWSIVGLVLYKLYEHPFLFVIGIGVNLIGQIYSGTAFSSFSMIIFLLFIIGYFYYAFNRTSQLFSYFFAIGLSIQLLILSLVQMEQYYWFMFFMLAMYALGELIQKQAFRKALLTVSLFSIFIFKMVESFMLQDEYFLKELVIQSWFFPVLGIVWLAVLVYKLRQSRRLEIIDLLLFVPLFMLPYAYIFIIISMFIYSLYWLITGFQRQMDDKIIIGIVSFIFSTFTVYIQFAWETLNKSLFFLIGGILLFVLSFVLDRQRRKSEKKRNGDDT